MVLFGLAFCLGANDPTDEIRDVIKARRFEALNAKGELVGLFTGNERGGVLVVHGAWKRGTSAVLDATARGGQISTTDTVGRPLVELGFNDWGDVDPLPDPLPEPLHTGGTLWLNVGDETVKNELGKKPRRIAVRLEAYKEGGKLELMN